MTFNYARMKSSAERLIARFGRSATLRQKGTGSDPWAPAIEYTDTAIILCDLGQMQSDASRDDVSTGQETRKVFVSTSAGVAPQTKDEIGIGSEAFEVVSVTILNPGGTVLYYDLQISHSGVFTPMVSAEAQPGVGEVTFLGHALPTVPALAEPGAGAIAAAGQAPTAGVSTFNPTSLFTGGEEGVFIDTAKGALSSLSPVTAAGTGDAVALLIDGKYGAAYSDGSFSGLGSELITNGDFDSDISSWNPHGGAPGLTWSAGRMNLDPGTTFNGAKQQVPTEAGKWYVFSLDYFPIDNNEARLSVGDGSSVNSILNYTVADGVSENGTYTILFKAESSASTVSIRSGNTTGEFEVDNISVKHLPGDHIYQSVVAERPTLFADGSLGFDGTDDNLTLMSAGLGSDMTFALSLKGSDQQFLVFSGDAGSQHSHPAHDGSTGSTAEPSFMGDADLYVNGDLLEGAALATRDALHETLSDGNWKSMMIQNADISSWTNLHLSNYSGWWFDGKIGPRILVIDRDLTAGEATQVEDLVTVPFDPVALFESSEEGVLWANDINRPLTSLTPVTPAWSAAEKGAGSGDGVAFILDTSQGAGMVTSGTSGSSTTAFSGLGSELASGESQALVENENLILTPTLVPGDYYLIDYTVSGSTGEGAHTVRCGTYSTGSPYSASFSGDGNFVSILPAKDSNVISIGANAFSTLTVTVNSVRHLPGDHIYQPTEAEQPEMYDNGVLYFDGVDDGLTLMSSGLGSDMTVALALKTSDPKFIVLSGSGNQYIAASEESSASTGVNAGAGAVTLSEGGSAPATRGESHSLLATGNWVFFKVSNAVLGSWPGVKLPATGAWVLEGEIGARGIVIDRDLTAQEQTDFEAWQS